MADNPFLRVFRPYIPDATTMRELTPLPLIVGTLLGIMFGASSLYLVLKTGLTVSASIPVAVISITLFRILSKARIARDATILENNIVQTAGSAGESIAFGVGVTMPAILILGFDLDITRVMLVAVLGGLLGILMMIPLRRALIKEQHGFLKYPEGTACAEVLKAGASKESREMSEEGNTAESDDAALQGGKIISVGFVIGFVYKSLVDVFSFFKPEPGKEFSDETFKGGSVALENNPALLGVGYIIGPYISAIMMAGGVLSYLVLIPMIKVFGEGAAEPIAPELSKTISEMGPGDVRGAYILYIGAGAVATAGIISLFRSLPTIWSGLKSGLADLRGSSGGDGENLPRTDRDLSMKWVVVGVIVLMAAIMLAPQLGLSVFSNPFVSILGAFLIVVLGFLFVTVSSRLTGEVGSSSNPISGMTVATLLITCLVFWLLGWTAPDPYFVTALSIGGIVCIAASNGGTTSQDLKTGFLVGGTPRRQQIAILIGALASALVIGPILLLLNDNGTVYATSTTFSKVEKDVKLDASRLAPYTGEEKPPTDKTYLYFENTVAPGEKKPEVKDLTVGKYLVDETGKVVLKKEENFPKGARIPPGTQLGATKKLAGVQASEDSNNYRSWHKTDNENKIPPGEYLVDEASGEIKYLVDPAINGKLNARADLSDVQKFDAPKATLMSYIIKGILSQELPWGLVLIGAMIAIVLELTGAPALAFAVGLYLPLSTSAPIFVGGMVRYFVDLYLKRKLARQNLSEAQIIAETDKSNGVLLASGYIAGAAVAGILFAIFALNPTLEAVQKGFKAWSEKSNSFFDGNNSDWMGMIPFWILALVLYYVGRELFLTGKRK